MKKKYFLDKPDIFSQSVFKERNEKIFLYDTVFNMVHIPSPNHQITKPCEKPIVSDKSDIKKLLVWHTF